MIRQLLEQAAASWPEGPIAVAISGGLDSTALLHACAHSASIRARGLGAIHVDHRLHADSAAWAARVAAFAESLGIECRVLRVDVGSTKKSGLEAAARRARYAALESALPRGTIVLTAHHADDQAETVLLRLLRGAGVAGLGAMRAQRALGACTLARPWLAVPRAAIAEYARAHALAWIDDPSNERLAHDRNFLRHRVLPLLAERWPHAAASVGASAALCAESARVLERAAAIALADCQGVDPHTLHVAPLRALPRFERAEVLRAWLAALGLPAPDAPALEAIENTMLDVDADAVPRVAWRGAELRRYRDMLYALAPRPRIDPAWSVAWDGVAPLALPFAQGTLQLDAPAPLGLSVRLRRGGERIVLADNRPSQSLKHLLQDLGVPPWERARLPLVFRGDELLAAGDLVIAAALEAWQREHARRLRWIRG